MNHLDTASPHVAQRTSPDGVKRRRLAEKQNTGITASECTAETDFVFFFSFFSFLFFCSLWFFVKTLMIKKKMFLVFKEMYPM